MLEQTIESTNDRGILRKAVGAAGQAAKIAVKVETLKEKASHLYEDKLVDAKRMAKKGRHAAEDLVDDTAYRIKKQPLRSVGITFGLGLGLGIVAGWLLGRNSLECEQVLTEGEVEAAEL